MYIININLNGLYVWIYFPLLSSQSVKLPLCLTQQMES